MGIDNYAEQTCEYCGAVFRLFSISNRSMGGLAKSCKRKHEFKCKDRTPKQRRQWAKPYLGKDRYESSIVVDLEDSAFKE